jgi:hypothetical protein
VASVAKFNAKRAGLKILHIKLPTVHVAASIVTVKNRTSSPTAKLFIDCVRDVARSISAQAKRGKSPWATISPSTSDFDPQRTWRV